MLVNRYKFRHFFLNKYFISLFRSKRYFMTYDYTHKALWFRTYKVGSRTIDEALKRNSKKGSYIYASPMSYCPRMFRKYFKFSFVRNPETRFISAWKDKVLKQNYFNFSEQEHEKMKDLNHFLTWVESLDIDHCDEHLQSQNSLIDLSNIDFLGRFENFTSDLKTVMNILDIDSSGIEHLNKGTKEDLILNKEQRLRIYHIYQKDFQIFYPDHIDLHT
jgi:hypothetical protein